MQQLKKWIFPAVMVVLLTGLMMFPVSAAVAGNVNIAESQSAPAQQSLWGWIKTVIVMPTRTGPALPTKTRVPPTMTKMNTRAPLPTTTLRSEATKPPVIKKTLARTITAAVAPTKTKTLPPTRTVTFTQVPSRTSLATSTPTRLPTATKTSTPTMTPSNTPTKIPTQTATISGYPAPVTKTATAAPTQAATVPGYPAPVTKTATAAPTRTATVRGYPAPATSVPTASGYPVPPSHSYNIFQAFLDWIGQVLFPANR